MAFKLTPQNAISELVQNITKSFEQNEYVLGVFIYLKKAFDTVNHEILSQKLKLGINGALLEWFKSYLSNRNQCIVLEVYNTIKKSVYLDILCGVPHGSILEFKKIKEFILMFHGTGQYF